MFITATGACYHLHFTEYYLTDCAGKELIIPAFAFLAEEAIRHIYDEKVRNTIIYALSNYFNKNKCACLSYICDTKDGYARHRNIIFRKWLRETGHMSIERFDCKKEYNLSGLYASILIRSENPLKEYYLDAFTKALRAHSAGCRVRRCHHRTYCRHRE